MKRKAFANIAASSLIVGVTMVGCSGAAMRGPASASAQSGRQAIALAGKAEKALARRDVRVALTAAEGAVAAQPDNAAYRTLLGRAYLADGRFKSAETAFEDAMTLGNRDTRTIISLSLAKVALGKSVQARALLGAHTDILPAADYGLALAVAGDAPEAVRILSQASQDPSANAKTRQNFAYALALSGNWRDARLMAGQDMDPAAATQRIIGWAQTADAGAEPQRVAALVGTTLRGDDAGMPARLALVAPAADAPMLAQAEAPQAVQPAPVEVALAEASAPAPVRSVEVAASQPAPTIKAPENIARQPAHARTPRVVDEPVAARSMMRTAALIRPVEASGSSQWVVQLGAYDSAGVAKDGWQRMVRANARLAAYPVLNSQATVNGKLFHRVAVKGFADRASADAMCRAIRARHGQCFVRAGTPDAKPADWAKAPTVRRQQFASR